MQNRQWQCLSNGLAVLTFHAALVTAGLVSGAELTDQDWAVWRGPSGNGVAADGQKPVTEWTENQNILWSRELPGRGHSSPVIVGNRVILQTADEQAQVQSVLAVDADNGQPLWKRDVSQGGFPASIHNKNTHASSTVACSGSLIFASFFHHDAIQLSALDLNGEIKWQIVAAPFQPQQYKYGYAASPVLYQDSVIVVGDCDGGSFLASFDQRSGREVWKITRPARISYSSPIIAHVAGRNQLLLSGCDQVASYDPASGQQLWRVEATTMATCGTMVWDGDLVFASGGYPKSETVAIRADGSGKVVWSNNQKCYEQSMLAVDGYVYGTTDAGIAYCWKADTGEEQWKSRLGGQFSSSPVLAGGNIYQTNEAGVTFVFKADPRRMVPVASNTLGQEGFATLAAVRNRLYLRTALQRGGKRQEVLVCIGRR